MIHHGTRIGRSGFTLIELLIVTAIVAILSAATLALFVSPLREYARTNRVAEAEAGLGLALATLTADAHGAVRIEDDGRFIRFRNASGDNDAVYLRDNGGVLRRFVWPRVNDDLPAPYSSPGSVIASELLRSEVKVDEAARTVSFVLATGGELSGEPIGREAIWTANLSPIVLEGTP
jgi:prepilin-type N-terminal cleavage/methylation domain-containing protein